MADLSAIFDADRDGVVLRLHVSPRAAKSSVRGVHGDALRVTVAAPPVDGKANAETLRYVAELLGVRPSQCTLVSGEHSRTKRVRVSGCGGDAVRAALEHAVPH